ncbi:unnamed protein product [Mytilus edulis]|uniref:Uncharacterized protein n=1 Tax=Mytilus edulis TaxID=6550 RepID=A0A8S3UF73_MYTED|nr:unnamed protein product [Mytilus edulis]
MLQYGPVKHHSCMRFEGKHSFFKGKKIKNFNNLPYTLSRHHQLYMCMRQTGVDGNKSNNFLYDGDLVSCGREINFNAKYPNLSNSFSQLVGVHLQDELVVYETKSTSIHGLRYEPGCALVLRYENDDPVFGIVRDSIVFKKDKYFVIQCTSGPAAFNQHILHHTLELTNDFIIRSFCSLEYNWPLSVGKLVTMNINTHTCEIF